MKNRISVILSFLLILCLTCISQTANFWYFGDKAGLNFNNGSPVAVTDGILQNWEGGSTISDSLGNLLFYTNGFRVWNKQHQQMPNGIYLNGDISSSQAAIIIPKPGNSTLYYVFSSNGGTLGIQYSEVDMTLEGGLGDVNSNKNIVLQNFSTEKLTAVRHCNGIDFWVLSHDKNSNAFRCFLVTAAGVNTTPVISYAGLSYVGFATEVGHMKVSPDGKKLASANVGLNKFELLDFDPATGIVSNGLVFPTIPASEGAYGVEFSPDGSKLYGTIVNPGKLYQWDLAAGSTSTILNSGKLLGSSNYAGPLQLGPNGKIYMTNISSFLSIIHYPDSLGSLANYAPYSLSLQGRKANLSLPGFPSSYFYKAKSPLSFLNSVNCLRAKFIAINRDTSGVNNFVWNFGDVNSGVSNVGYGDTANHLFSAPGVYTVTLTQIKACEDIIIKKVITISTPKSESLLPQSVSVCAGKSVCVQSGVSGTCVWNTGEITSQICITPKVNTTYIVQITDFNGCLLNGCVNVIVNALPNLNVKVLPQTPTSFLLIASGGINYSWHPQKGLDCYACESTIAEIADPTEFCVDAVDNMGCTETACVSLNMSSVFIPNAFSPNDDGLNDLFLPVIQAVVSDYSLNIYNRWGNKIFESTDVFLGWNGKMQGYMCESGIYTYQLAFTHKLRASKFAYCGKLVLNK